MLLQYKLFVAVSVLLAVTPDASCRSRIAFGSKSEGYPFMVFLSVQLDAGLSRCGGSLIKHNWVLTAAHCVANERTNKQYDPEQMTVYLGSTKAEEGYKVAVNRAIVHEQFNKPTYLMNDIAVLELAEDVPEDKGATVQLAETLPDDKYAGQEALAVGWGRTEFNRLSPVLLEGKITMIDDNKCIPYKVTSPDGKVCSVAQNRQTKTGAGDSGGPILVDGDGQMVQIGLVSFGAEYRGNRTKYTGFTSTGYYHDWIEEHIAA